MKYDFSASVTVFRLVYLRKVLPEHYILILLSVCIMNAQQKKSQDEVGRTAWGVCDEHSKEQLISSNAVLIGGNLSSYHLHLNFLNNKVDSGCDTFFVKFCVTALLHPHC